MGSKLVQMRTSLSTSHGPWVEVEPKTNESTSARLGLQEDDRNWCRVW